MMNARAEIILRTIGSAIAGVASLAILAACGVDDTSAARAMASDRTESSSELKVHPSTRESEQSPGFLTAFQPVGRTTLRLARSGDAMLPASCAVDEAGTVYIAQRGLSRLHRWLPAEEFAESLDLQSGSAGRMDPVSLGWDGASARLVVLTDDGRRIAYYDRDGSLQDYSYLNAGHAGMMLGVLPDGRAVVGGERWETESSVTLLAVYDPDGRPHGMFFPMDSAVLANNQLVLYPVILTVDEDGSILAAEPTSFIIRRFAADGTVLDSFGVPPEGYAAPSPLPASPSRTDDLSSWLASWTPLRFLHGGAGFVFVGFEVRRPYHGYQLSVFDGTGVNVTSGLLSSARPACGRGDLLIFLERIGSQDLEIQALRFVDRAVSEEAS